MRSEARINESPLLRFRVVHRYATGVLDEVGGVRRRTRSSFPRESLRRRVIRSLLAERRLFPLRPAGGGPPDTAFAVHRVGMGVDLSIPDYAVSPVVPWRRSNVDGRRSRSASILYRHFHLGRHVEHGVQNGDPVGTQLHRAIKRAPAVHRRLPFVGADQVVQIGRGTRPVPERDHDIAFNALGPVGLLLGQFTRGDTVGPVGQPAQESTIVRHQAVDPGDHGGAGLSHPQSRHPSCLCILLTNTEGRMIYRAHDRGAELVTVAAAGLLDGVHPVRLAFQRCWHAVTLRAGTGEQALLWNLEHRPPVGARIVLSRRPCIWGYRGGEVKRHARLCRDAPRIDQTEAADPNVVLRTGGKGGQQVAALIVGDHNLGVPPRAQTGRFRDDPYAGLRSVGTGHHTADVGGTNSKLLGAYLARPRRQKRSDTDREYSCVNRSNRTHANLPSVRFGPHSPPRRGGVAAPLTKCREATEAAQTGWSDRQAFDFSN